MAKPAMVWQSNLSFVLKPALHFWVLVSIAVGVIFANANSTASAASLPPLPNNWPATLEIGVADSPGGAANLRSIAPFKFRYQYLAGGVNTGGGWANWNANGEFVTYYVQDSISNGFTPVFTYYMIFQSAPGGGSESQAIRTNLNNTSTMAAYFGDLKLFFQKASRFPNSPVVLHVEPDAWGYIQQQSTNDDASTYPVKVGSTGVSEVAGLPDNAAGFAQAIKKLRDLYAPNVVLAYHLSYWGTGEDPVYTNPTNQRITDLANRSGYFYKSLQTNFDVSFAEFRDRDAAFYQYQYGNPNAWWDSGDYDRNILYLSTFSQNIQKRIVVWQIPQGNTRMKAMNNTWNHYQDNIVQTLLDDPARTRLNQYVNAGVIAFLFGRGADGATCACDANNDGVTNPAAINGNNLDSLSSDDDGGFFDLKAKNYYTSGAIALGGSPATPMPSASPTPTISASFTPTAPLSPTPGQAATYATSATVSPSSVTAGSRFTVNAAVTSATAKTLLVDIEVYAPSGQKVFQQVYDNQVFSAGQQRTYSPEFTTSSTQALGTYTVKIGLFNPAWNGLLAWNDAAARFSVTAPSNQDVTPPQVTITNPLNGASIRRQSAITIRATASDNINVSKVEFYVNNVLKCTDSTAAYTCAWSIPNTRGVTYTLTAKAYDSSGNSATHAVQVVSR